MARLVSCGFELNSATVGVEATSASGAPTIQSSVVRSGTYALRISSLVSGTRQYLGHILSASDTNGPYFARAYFRAATWPTANNRIMTLTGSAGFLVWMHITSTGLLELQDQDGPVGSGTQLSLNTWYRLEIHYDRTGASSAHVVRGRVDGVEFAGSNTRDLSSGITQFRTGGNNNSEAQTQGDWYFDDVAVNDSTGSFQTSFPGNGKIIHLRPSAAGDANAFGTQTGGTAGSTNNYTRVSEVTPDDATTFNGSSTLNDEDLFNVDDAGVSATDTINVVSVGGRHRNNTADATAALKFEIEKAAAGTKTQGSAITPNSTTWRSGTVALGSIHSLITYQDPDAASWTSTTLNSMQIGYKLTTAGSNRIDVSAVWALIDYAPAAAQNNSGFFLMMGT